MALERHFRIIANICFHYGALLAARLRALGPRRQGRRASPAGGCWAGLGDRVRGYASSGTLRAPGDMAETAQRFLAEGFPAMKVRFQRGDWRDDIRALEAVRARRRRPPDAHGRLQPGLAHGLGPGHALELQGRRRRRARAGASSTPTGWRSRCFRGDYAGMRALRQATDVRIAGGEMTRELHEFRE